MGIPGFAMTPRLKLPPTMRDAAKSLGKCFTLCRKFARSAPSPLLRAMDAGLTIPESPSVSPGLSRLANSLQACDGPYAYGYHMANQQIAIEAGANSVRLRRRSPFSAINSLHLASEDSVNRPSLCSLWLLSGCL